jgi:hypothetical protein
VSAKKAATPSSSRRPDRSRAATRSVAASRYTTRCLPARSPGTRAGAPPVPSCSRASRRRARRSTRRWGTPGRRCRPPVRTQGRTQPGAQLPEARGVDVVEEAVVERLAVERRLRDTRGHVEPARMEQVQQHREAGRVAFDEVLGRPGAMPAVAPPFLSLHGPPCRSLAPAAMNSYSSDSSSTSRPTTTSFNSKDGSGSGSGWISAGFGPAGSGFGF